MANQDQGRFDQTLLTGAEKLLIDEGRADLATQLDKIFTEVKPGNKLSDARPTIRQGLVPCKSPRSTEKSEIPIFRIFRPKGLSGMQPKIMAFPCRRPLTRLPAIFIPNSRRRKT